MLSAGLSAQGQGRAAAPGPHRACRPSHNFDSSRCKPSARRRTAHSQGRAAVAAAAPDSHAGSSRQSNGIGEPVAAAGEPAQPVNRSAITTSLLVLAATQMLALAAALACLILLPAYVSGRLAEQPARAATSFTLYLLFFASGTISRMLRHGRLAEARRDAQRSSGGGRLALLLFAAVLVPAGHWAAWWDPSLARLAAIAPTPTAAAVVTLLLSFVGYSCMLAGWALNAAAAAALGQAYNRVVAPEQLVTTGPFALVQHPIYTSYMLLFAGHALSLGSPAAAALLLLGCLGYYSCRTRLEEAVLEGAFGDHYRHYRSSTGRFLPRLR